VKKKMLSSGEMAKNEAKGDSGEKRIGVFKFLFKNVL
jgi:hypothetical protein